MRDKEVLSGVRNPAAGMSALSGIIMSEGQRNWKSGSGKVGINQAKMPERAEKLEAGKRKSRLKSGKSVRKGRIIDKNYEF